ncbi:hypothetical protein SAMN05421759_108157 [Roseivivax lentus]|uniref:Uncharacterized protein n=1 Tax=Roseivivax lentus TaxID=633194 RepID=A0A1N7NJE9_9RHOB|nr:hypothetical protein [Roseivivax lentus]SIS98407.1 hypothetical protein SAMN05421759_108157 [Roseivivax lentus]
MTYMTPMAATQMWFAWTGALWAQQIKVAQIMTQAAQQGGYSMIGIEPLKAVPADPRAEAGAPRRTVSPRVMATITEAGQARRAMRKPSAPPQMPPRRTHATPV